MLRAALPGEQIGANGADVDAAAHVGFCEEGQPCDSVTSMTSLFTERIERLRRMPVRIDSWRLEQVGRRNEGPYKRGYQAIEVRDSTSESLIDVSVLGLVSSDYYLDEYLDGTAQFEVAAKNGLLYSRAFLRIGHARRLAKADAFLRQEGLFLFVRSGWRHRKVQEIAKATFAELSGKDLAAKLFASAEAGIAPPPHSTGGVADLEVGTLEGDPLHVTANIDGTPIHGLYELELLAQEDPPLFARDRALGEALANRRILYHVLCTPGVVFTEEADLFVEHPGEHWHFGEGDPLSAFLKRLPWARCGESAPTPGARNTSASRVLAGAHLLTSRPQGPGKVL